MNNETFIELIRKNAGLRKPAPRPAPSRIAEALVEALNAAGFDYWVPESPVIEQITNALVGAIESGQRLPNGEAYLSISQISAIITELGAKAKFQSPTFRAQTEYDGKRCFLNNVKDADTKVRTWTVGPMMREPGAPAPKPHMADATQADQALATPEATPDLQDAPVYVPELQF